MILEPECVSCLISQIHKGLKLIDPTISKDLVIETQRKMMGYLASVDILNTPGPYIGKRVYELIAEALGMDDPYIDLKRKYNSLALEYYDRVKDIIKNAEDPLFEAIAVSAIGNTIDFGAHHDMDVIRDIKNFTPDDLAINDIPKFRKSIEKVNQLLILGDNTGEIVFDKVLVETLQELYPEKEIIFTVRASPIINDATMEDAEEIGLTKIVKVIKSQGLPGFVLESATEEFRNYFYNTDGIILSKGQGNFESLYGLDIPGKDVFYLLKAKCFLMERLFDVKLGSLIFKKKTSDF